MKKSILAGTALTIFAALILLMAGCGGGEDTAADAESAAPAEQTAPAEQPAPETEGETVAAHDCAGGCGMKNWPEDQMTEIDGKWYCAGCAKKVQADGKEEGQGDG